MSTRMDRMSLDLEVAAADPFLDAIQRQRLNLSALMFRRDDFEEDKHPRSPDGKFGSGAGGEKAGAGDGPDKSTRSMTPVEKAAAPKGSARSGPRTPVDPGKPVGPDATTRAVKPVAPAGGGRGGKHVVEIHNADGVQAHHFDTKKEARAFGMKARAEGRTAFMHAKNSPWRATKDDRMDDDRERLEELYDEIYADDDDADDPEDLSDEELAEAILARSDSAHREDAFEATATAKKRGGSHLVGYTLAMHPKRDAAAPDDPEDDEDAKDGGIDEDEEDEAPGEDEKERADAEEQKCPKCGEMVVPKDGKCPSCGAAMKASDY